MKKLSLITLLFLMSCSSNFISRYPADRKDLSCQGAIRFFKDRSADDIGPIAKLSEIDDDTAMEIELRRSPKDKEGGKALMSLLDTSDGTLKPLFDNELMPSGAELSAELKQELVEKGFAQSVEQALEAEFSKLPYMLQVKVLKHQGSYKEGSFFSNRNVPGLKIKKKVTLNFKKKTRFLNKLYQPGKHEVDISDLFPNTPVEYRGPKSITNFHGVEVHARTDKFSSGDLTSEVWKLLRAANLDQKRGHVHVVTPINLEKIRVDKDLYAMLMSDYWRRVNIVAEMISIIDKGTSIRVVQNDGAIYFSHFSPGQVRLVGNYVRSVAESSDPRAVTLGDRAKMGYVGFHGADKYDAETPVWGMQFRTVSRPQKSTFQTFLNVVQKNMKETTFGSIDENKMRRWMKDDAFITLQGRLGEATYHSGISDPDLKPSLSINPMKFHEYTQKNKELSMLLHNWDDDPLFWENPSALEKIKTSQKNALAKFSEDMEDQEMKEIMWEFLEESNLYNLFLNSIGG